MTSVRSTEMEYRNYASGLASKYGIPQGLFSELIQQESSWKPNATSSAGAYGLGQLMPGTAADLGVDRYDWKQNLEGSARYFSTQYDKFGDWALALSAYNSGPGGSEKNGLIENNPETKSYVATIIDKWKNSSLGDFIPSPIPGVSAGDIAGAAIEGGKAATSFIGSWQTGLAKFFSADTLLRGVVIVIGVVLLVATILTILAKSDAGKLVIQAAAPGVGKLAALAA